MTKECKRTLELRLMTHEYNVRLRTEVYDPRIQDQTLPTYALAAVGRACHLSGLAISTFLTRISGVSFGPV